MLRAFQRFADRIALNDRSFKFLFERQETDEAISLDCETTGFDPWVDDIISIAAIPIKGDRILTSQAYRAIIKPEAILRTDSIKVHQLRQKDLENGRRMADVLPELLRFIGARPLVGYWIAFDKRMLDKHVMSFLNIRLPNDLIDVSTLYHDRKYGHAPPGTAIDLRYAAIQADLSLPKLQAHDAFNDALGAAEMFVMLKDMKRRGVRFNRTRSVAEPIAAPAE
jgi:DNA polymerase III subunit epsilon